MSEPSISTRQHLQAIVLLVVIALSCVQAEAPTLARSLRLNHNDIQLSQDLGIAGISPSTTIGVDTSEARGFNTAAIKEFAEAGTQKINAAAKKITESAKLKFTSNNQETVDKLFTRYKVHRGEVNIFKSKEYRKWAKSVSNSYSKDREAGYTAMMSTLTAKYGDESLASMLAAAETELAAILMSRVQIDSWVRKNTPTDDVFRFLKLDKAEDKLLGSSRWIEYVGAVGKEDPYELMFLKLSQLYDDEGLAKLLIEASGALSKTRVNTDKLEDLLFQKWENAEKSVDDVYKLLKLENEEPSKLLSNKVLSIWLHYARKYSKFDTKDGQFQFLVGKLAKHFNDEKLVDFILASEKMPNTQLRAMMLKSNLPSYWKTSGKSAEDVFAILKLKNVDKDKLFENPMWSTWVAFLQKDTRNPDEKMFAVLKNQYGEEGLRTLIANAKNSEATEMIGTKLQQEFWRSEGKTADDVFQLLKLSYEGDAFLQSPALSTWVSYATHLQKIQLTNHEYYKYGAVMELEKHYSHTDLARKVSDAMVLATTTKNSKMEKAIGVLQTQQFKQWKLIRRLSPNEVTTMMIVSRPNDPSNNQVIRAYYNFVINGSS